MSFEKVTLMFVNTQNVGLTLASEKSSRSLRSLLESLGDTWNVPIGHHLDDEIESKIDRLVTNIFIHQLARLSLFTKTQNLEVKSAHHY